ncbi:MAG: hypothetical protein ACKOA9_02030 [Actinomycetota bacterium]
MNKVKVGFFSFTEITDPAEHRAYNEWHQLDHMPEQLPIPGIVHGQRWVSTPACRDARAVDEDPLRAIHYMTLYLMADPVDTTLRDFMEVGQQLRALGRFHLKRRAAVSGPLQWLDAHAAPRVLVSAEAVPYRPNRGVYVIVEEPVADADPADADAWVRDLHEHWAGAVCAVPGVAGIWQFATSPRLHGAGWSDGGRRITVCYLDDEPLAVAEAIRPRLAERRRDAPVRPVHAGPLETVVPYQWDWFD